MNHKTIIGLIGLALGIITLTAMIFSTPVLVQPVQAAPQKDNVSCGTTVTGYIRDSNYYDYHYFYGRAGDEVSFFMSSTSGTLDSMMRLYYSTPSEDDFEFLEREGFRGGFTGASISDFTLPRTGTYSINVRRVDGKDGTTYGGYRLVVVCNSTASTGSSSSSCPRRVPVGTSWEGTIGASTSNKISTEKGDMWVLDASSGDRVAIEFSTVEFEPFVGLYRYSSGWVDVARAAEKDLPTPTPDPSGLGIIEREVPTWYIEMRLPVSDCYYLYIVPSSSSDARDGSYTLDFSIR